MDEMCSPRLNKLSDLWDCACCPIAEDLLKWLDDLSRANADLEIENKRLLKMRSRQHV